MHCYLTPAASGQLEIICEASKVQRIKSLDDSGLEQQDPAKYDDVLAEINDCHIHKMAEDIIYSFIIEYKANLVKVEKEEEARNELSQFKRDLTL